MGEGIFNKIKNWISEDPSEYDDDTYNGMENEESSFESLEEEQFTPIVSKSSKIVSIHEGSKMKVVIVEPINYDEVTTIADHLKQRRIVIVNLEKIEESRIRKAIFEFMNGAIYVLDGDIQRVSQGIYILAPNNVNIDASIKKELESKTLFHWQNK